MPAASRDHSHTRAPWGLARDVSHPFCCSWAVLPSESPPRWPITVATLGPLLTHLSPAQPHPVSRPTTPAVHTQPPPCHARPLKPSSCPPLSVYFQMWPQRSTSPLFGDCSLAGRSLPGSAPTSPPDSASFLQQPCSPSFQSSASSA